jgi:hypothetical protein
LQLFNILDEVNALQVLKRRTSTFENMPDSLKARTLARAPPGNFLMLFLLMEAM